MTEIAHASGVGAFDARTVAGYGVPIAWITALLVAYGWLPPVARVRIHSLDDDHPKAPGATRPDSPGDWVPTLPRARAVGTGEADRPPGPGLTVGRAGSGSVPARRSQGGPARRSQRCPARRSPGGRARSPPRERPPGPRARRASGRGGEGLTRSGGDPHDFSPLEHRPLADSKGEVRSTAFCRRKHHRERSDRGAQRGRTVERAEGFVSDPRRSQRVAGCRERAEGFGGDAR